MGAAGAEHAFDITLDRAQIFERLSARLREFRAASGGTIVDVTGICNGRDVDYYKFLSAKTGVHVVACTGFVGGDTALRTSPARAWTT